VTQQTKDYLLSITIATSILSTITASLVSYENNQLKSDIVIIVKDVADRQKQIDELNSTNSKLKDELFWCKHANGQLLEHCDPSGIKKAINKTPLPKRG